MNVRLKKAFLLSLLALTPDLDALFHIHRSISHSAIILLAITSLIWLAARKPWIRTQIPFALFALISHLILDVFTGYTPILWPLSQSSIWIQMELRAYLRSSPSLRLSTHLLFEPTQFQRFESLDAPLFTSEGLIASLMLITPILMKKLIIR